MVLGYFWAGAQTKQGVGEKGVDKRIDVLAKAIKAGLTVHDLPELELAYAPPYSSAKDPVNMAGYVALNLLDGMLETVQWHEIDALVAAGEFVLDVRENAERLAGHIAGTAHIPLHEIRDRLDEIQVARSIYIHCHAGLRGYLALRILQENGFQAKSLNGGFETYAAAKSGAASHVKEGQKDLALIN